jgi:hypothetical protein
MSSLWELRRPLYSPKDVGEFGMLVADRQTLL